MEKSKMDEIKARIKSTRKKKDGSEIKDSSVQSYINTLEMLRRRFNEENFKFFESEDTLASIEKMDKQYTTKRNYYNAIIVYLYAMDLVPDLIDKYVKIRDQANEKYQEDQASGIISKKQEANFVPKKDIVKMITQMGEAIKSVDFKHSFSAHEYSLLQRYIMMNIYIRLPLRNDIAGMMAITKRQYNTLTMEDKKSTNYLVSSSRGPMFMVLNEYKTSAKYSEKIVEVPKDLEKLLKEYIKINKYGYLFKSNRGNPYTRNQISQLLMKTSQDYLGKNISTTMLRKIYLSDKYADVKDEMAKDSHIMGHSVSTQQSIYVKKQPTQDASTV